MSQILENIDFRWNFLVLFKFVAKKNRVFCPRFFFSSYFCALYLCKSSRKWILIVYLQGIYRVLFKLYFWMKDFKITLSLWQKLSQNIFHNFCFRIVRIRFGFKTDLLNPNCLFALQFNGQKCIFMLNCSRAYNKYCFNDFI